MSLKEQASRAISLLALYEVEGNSIERIISIVQNNQKYFGVRLGNSAIEAAANKLEQLVSEAAEHSVQRTVEACPDDRHMYYTAFLNYEFCPYCGQRLHSR